MERPRTPTRKSGQVGTNSEKNSRVLSDAREWGKLQGVLLRSGPRTPLTINIWFGFIINSAAKPAAF